MNYLFFDLDGTLTEPYDGISRSFIYALEACGKPRPSERELRLCIGPPLYDSFTGLFGMTGEEAKYAIQKYRERYHVVGWTENELIPGAEECLRALSACGKTLALATSKPKVFAERILRSFSLDGYFTYIAGCGLDGSLNTKAEVLAHAMRELGAPPQDCAMIGDRKYDTEGAKACGVFSVGVRTGYAEAGELEEAGTDVILPSLGAVKEYFLSSDGAENNGDNCPRV